MLQQCLENEEKLKIILLSLDDSEYNNKKDVLLRIPLHYYIFTNLITLLSFNESECKY